MPIQRTLLLAAALATAAPAVASADHPHLFFGAADVPGLRSKAGSTHRPVGDALKGGTAEFWGTTVAPSADVRWQDGRTLSMGDPRDIGNALVVFAFGAQLDGDPRSLDLAKGWLLTVAGWSTFDLDGQKDLTQAHLLGGAAIAYDMLAPSLSEAERGKVRAALAREADALLAAGESGTWWAASYTQNHNWIDHAAVGLAGLALEGEVDQGRAARWLAFATENARKIAATIDGISDGTWHEGYTYLSYGLQWHLPFVEALRRAGREDLTDLAVLRGLGAARAYAQIPEAPHTYVLSSGDFNSFTNDEGLLGLRYAASRMKDGVAQAAADRWSSGVPRKTYAPEANQAVFEFLFYDPSVPAADLGAAPLDWFGADQQAVVFRSGWEKGSTIFALKSGAFGGRSVWGKLGAGGDVGALNFSHDHADDNGFYLYAKGAWAAPEAQGYYIGHRESPGPAANETSFHNSMLVDGRGQLGSGVRENGDDGDRYAWFQARAGSIPFHASSDHYAFATGDGSKLYPADLGVRRWDRNALFLDRENVVLFDVVEAAQPRTWSWLAHFTGSAAQEGGWIHGQAENGQALGVAVVAPANASISFAGVAPVKATNFVKDGSFTGAEVRSPAAAQTAFLTALVPVPEASWASRAQVEAADASRPEAGLVLTSGARRTVALFSRDGARVEAAGVSMEGLAGVAATKDGALDRVLLVRGSAIAKDGKELVRVDGGTELLEADGVSSDTLWLSGKELKTARVWAPSARAVKWFGKDVPFQRDGEVVSVRLVQALEGAGTAGEVVADAAPEGATASAAKAGGGCGAAGPGDLAAVIAALLALVVIGRARRRAPATGPVTELPRRKDREEPPARRHG